MTEKADATQENTGKQSRKPLVAGNWKMHGQKEQIQEVLAIRDALMAMPNRPEADVMICPPATLLMVMAELIDKSVIAFGGQDCHAFEKGPHTGDISAAMLKDAGASAVIVGHSERREDHGETDDLVQKKAMATHNAGLASIICVGETKGQRQYDLTLDVINRQLEGSVPPESTPQNTIIAYEPVWAIGTGLVPTLDDIATVHANIRETLEKRFPEHAAGMRILYGGSVKPGNAGQLMKVENVDGALVGGASLKADDFMKIINVYGSDKKTPPPDPKQSVK